jgi:hypothetical protein
MTHPDLLTPKNNRVPVLQKAGWVWGPVWTGSESLAPHTPPRIRFPDSPSRSNSLYPLWYPGPAWSGSWQRLHFAVFVARCETLFASPRIVRSHWLNVCFGVPCQAVLYVGNDAVCTEVKHLCHLSCSGSITSTDSVLVSCVNRVIVSAIELLF